MEQALQVVGAIAILSAYALAQARVLDSRNYAYLLLNLGGALLLAYLAFDERQWGFVLLETAWALLSLWGLLRRPRPAAAPD